MEYAPVHWEMDGYTLRPAQAEDAEPYFQQNYAPLDPEVARLTGCKPEFTHDEVVNFFLHSLDDADRRWFLILAPDGRIVGESVINEIDWNVRSANFRICLFHPEERNRGVGSWAIRTTRDYAFASLGLHRLSLNVYSFNPRAEKAYRAAGFRQEGVLRDALRDGNSYADDILMALLEDDWRALKA